MRAATCLLPALVLLGIAPVAYAQPADSVAVAPLQSHVGAEQAGAAPRVIETPIGAEPRRHGCGASAAASGHGHNGGCVLPDQTLTAVPMELTVGGAGGGGDGLLNVSADLPFVTRPLDGHTAVALSARGVLGAGSGVRAGAGLTAGVMWADTQALRGGVRVGGWAETSPVGRAYGPVVEGSARFYVLRLEAGAVVAGAAARYGRAVLELPLAISGASGALPFVGLGVEARRYGDTGQTLWLVSLSAGL